MLISPAARVNAVFASSRMRSRLRSASALGFRSFGVGSFIYTLKACKRRVTPFSIVKTEASSVLSRAGNDVNLDCAGAAEMTEKFGATSTTDDVLAGVDLHGKRILVTGVSAGLGVETARALAARGATVIGAARDLAKAERATAGIALDLIQLDLANLASVRACADALHADGLPFDAVIANAGVMRTP